MLQSPRTITRRFVAVMTVLATLIAAGFTSPSAALALFVLPVSGPVCGFTQTYTNNGNGFSLSGTAGTMVTITVTSSSAADISFFLADNTALFYMKDALSKTGTFVLPVNTVTPGVYFFELLAPQGTITASISCSSTAGADTISTDGRLNNNGDQGAQSVAIYCSRDGSLNLIPLQLSNPGPGSESMKNADGKTDLVLVTARLSTLKETTHYADGITVTPYSDGTWTVRRKELGTDKQYSFIVTSQACSQS